MNYEMHAYDVCPLCKNLIYREDCVCMQCLIFETEKYYDKITASLEKWKNEALNSDMKWIACKNKMPPKNEKFLFSYEFGIGLGEYGQCYTTINGNSERTHHGYILILDPHNILDGDNPFTWDEETLIEMEVNWMPLPKPPKDNI